MGIVAAFGVTDRTDFVKVNSCSMTGELNGHWELHAQLEDRGRGFRPTKGQQIKIYDDAVSPVTIYFIGRIKGIVERAPDNTSLQFDVSAQDYNEVLYRRLVTATYQNQSLYTIVMDIWANVLSGEGVTTNHVDDPSPPVVITEPVRFDHETVASVFEKLQELTGYCFYIDFENDLHCSLFTTATAPFSLTDTSGDWKDFEITKSDENYVNRQHVRGATVVNITKTDTIVAIAGQWQFPTTGLIVTMISVTRNGAPETFVAGPKPGSFPAPWAAGYDWAYYDDMYAFELDRVDMGAAIGAGDVVVITYTTGVPLLPGGAAAGPNVATSNDYAEQAARAALEGGSGIHEAIEEQPDIIDSVALQAFADGRIRQRATDPATIRVTILKPGLMPGQQLPVSLTRFDLNHSPVDLFLITRVTYNWICAAEDTPADSFECQVEGTNGEPVTDGVGYMTALVQMARIGASESIVTGGIGAGSGSGRAFAEWPIGGGTRFYLTYIPTPPESLHLYLNGVFQTPGVDYTLTGGTIVYSVAPGPISAHFAVYLHGGLSVLGAGGGARQFAGAGQVQWVYSADLAIIGDLTLGIWVKTPPAGGGIILVYGKSTNFVTSENDTYGLEIVWSVSGWRVRYWHDQSGGVSDTGTFLTAPLMASNTWYFVALTRVVSTKTVSLYLGALGSALAFAESEVKGTNPYDGQGVTNALSIGSGFLVADSPYTGVIDDYYIWNRVLSLLEMQTAMGGVPSQTGLVLGCRTGDTPEVDESHAGHAAPSITDTTVVAGH